MVRSNGAARRIIPRVSQHSKAVKESWPLEPEDMWRVIGISLTHELEESKVRVGGTCEMRIQKMIWFVGSRGHVARDHHFVDS
jgi:hypothetical protein